MLTKLRQERILLGFRSKDRLKNIYGGEFNFLKNFNIKQATIKQPVQYFDQKYRINIY